MSSYPLSNVLLPAVIISSAVFSTLTLPFAFIKKEPVVVEIPPFFSGEIQPLFNGEHKDVAIPYIGFSIVVSVGAGIASVEVHRRWHTYRESVIAQKQEQNSQLNSFGKAGQQAFINSPEYLPEISALDLPLKNEIFKHQSPTTPDAFSETQAISADNLEQIIDATQQVESHLALPAGTAALSTDSEQQDSSSVTDRDNSLALEASEVGNESAVQSLDLAKSKVLEAGQQYQRCRIKVPHLKRRLLAILVEGQYYSFFRVEATKEKVLENIAKLNHKVKKTVVTKTEKGYFIWTWEPEVEHEV
jgi:hypothetical protein